MPTVFGASREALEEAVFLLSGLIIRVNARHPHTQEQIFTQHNLRRIGFCVARMNERDGRRSYLHAVLCGLGGHELIAQHAHLVLESVPGINRLTIDGDDAVALFDTGFSRCSIRHDAVYVGQHKRRDEARGALHHGQQVQVAGQVDAHELSIADDVHPLGGGQVTINVGVEVLERTLVGTQQDVMVVESIRLGLLVETHSVSHVLDQDVRLPPIKQHHGIDKKSQEKVDGNTANHDEQALPCGFGAKLPRFGRLFHLFGIETLVYHARNLTVAAQRKPSHTIGSVAMFGLETEQMALPLANADIEKDKELFNPYTEELGKKHVSAFVQED